MSYGGGGVRKVPEKCHVLFEWPLNWQVLIANVKGDIIVSLASLHKIYSLLII